MQVAMSGLLGERVVCVVHVFLFCLYSVAHRGLQDTTRMSMTVVVREDLCVFAGGACALWGRSLHKGVRGAK